MKRFVLMMAALGLAIGLEAKDYVVSSPDGAVVVTVSDAGTSSPFRQMLARANVYL